jgi:hypothetical protein
LQVALKYRCSGPRLDHVVEEVERRLVEAEPIERLAEGVFGLLLDGRDGHLVAGDDPMKDQAGAEPVSLLVGAERLFQFTGGLLVALDGDGREVHVVCGQGRPHGADGDRESQQPKKSQAHAFPPNRHPMDADGRLRGGLRPSVNVGL